MKTISNLVKKNKKSFAVFALALAFASFAGSNNLAYAACPAVPADCTVDDVVGTSATTIVDTTLATLVSNLDTIVAGAVAIMVGFALIKLALRWSKKFIK